MESKQPILLPLNEVRADTRDFGVNTLETMYDSHNIKNLTLNQLEHFELDRLKDNVTFWKDKVDALL